MTSTKKCEFCDKRGLPLLLVRDAIAPAGAGAPLAEQLPIPLDSRAAHYTKRILRTGYVNVYDEARKRWDAYFVTPDGYFLKILQTPGAAIAAPPKPFNCPDEGHRAVASCITITDPKNATKVWIGFSDAEWTPAVRTANESAAYRQRHMVQIDVQAALAGAQQPHAVPIAHVSNRICEYAMDSTKFKKALGWGPNQVNSRYEHTTRLLQECDALRPGKGLIVTVPDPAGIAQEVAALMKWNFDTFVSNPEYKRNVAASDGIETIRRLVRAKAEADELAAGEKLASDWEQSNPLGHMLSQSTRDMTESVRKVTPSEAERAIRDAWKKYDEKFDDKAHRRWRAGFDAKLSVYDKEKIAPLATSHVAWMRSEVVSNYFICNFDRNTMEVGVVYVEALRRCLMGTQDKLACSKLYEEWLLGDPADTKNLLLQALALNQAKILEMLKKDLAVTIDNRQYPWDNILAAYGAMAQNAQNVLAQLLVQVIGAIIRFLGKVVDLPAKLWSGVVLLGAAVGSPLVKVEIVGTRAQFRELLMAEILRNSSGEPIPPGKLRRAVDMEMRRQGIYGEPVNGGRRMRWIAMADKRIYPAMPAGLTANERATWVARSVTSIAAMEQAHLNGWRAFINTDLRAGVVAAGLQIWCLGKLREDNEKSLVNEKTDAQWRLNAGLIAITGTVTEAIGNALKGIGTLGLRYGQGLTTTGARVFSIMGRTAGVFGGIVVAVMDLRKAYESFGEGQAGLGLLFASSAFAGLGLTVAFAAGAAVPVILVLLGLVIAIGVIIEYIKDNPLQDWLERCPWGVLVGQRYSDTKTEQQQLELAFK